MLASKVFIHRKLEFFTSLLLKGETMEKFKVLICSRSFGRLSEEPIKIIEEVAIVERVSGPLKEEDLIKILPSYDGVIVGTDEITRGVIESAERLKVVAKHGAGLDNVDLKAATEKRVIVTYVPGANAESVADFTFCLILSLIRHLIDAHLSTKAGRWESRKFIGTELYRKTLGIIGMGAIGSRVARRAKGFDMKILCYTAHPEKHNEEAKKYDIKFVDLDTLLKESDVITIHCALTPKTEKLIGEREIALMKKSAILINTARGPIIDEDALYKALKKNKIAGAALDVYSKEPPGADYPLFKLDNVIVTPHIASYTKEAIINMDLIQARDVVKALRGERPEFVANPEVFTRLDA